MSFIQASNERASEYKNPKKAFYFSLIPGLGQMYNGKILKSALFMGLEFSAYCAWKNNLKFNYMEGDSRDNEYFLRSTNAHIGKK